MADNNPDPSGGVPPKPADAPKVQPKKETVRISLPPKPTSTSTIKLPSLPAGGKPPAPTAAQPPGAAPAVPSAAKPPGAPKPPAAAAPPGARVAKPAVAAPSPAPAGVPRPAAAAAPAPAARGRAAGPRSKSSPLDTGLTIAAAVLSIGALVSILLLLNMK